MPASIDGDREALGARARLAELDRDHIVKLVGGHRRDQELVAAARRNLAHLIAREPLAGDEDHARGFVLVLDRARDVEALGQLGVEHDERRFLFEEQAARFVGGLRDEHLEPESQRTAAP